MQITKYALMSRDESEIVGYQIQISANPQQMVAIEQWAKYQESIIYPSGLISDFNTLLSYNLSGEAFKKEVEDDPFKISELLSCDDA